QFPPMYFNAIAGELDLACYRLEAKDWDENKEEQFQEWLALAGDGAYPKAGTTKEQLEYVKESAKMLMGGIGFDYSEFEGAPSPAEGAKALRKWLDQQEGYLLKPMN